jgi:hypothetical protein
VDDALAPTPDLPALPLARYPPLGLVNQDEAGMPHLIQIKDRGAELPQNIF